MLFRSSEVYDALLKLCANGDVEIQTSALKAIFAWKDNAVNRYQEHLVNLLDEARFREEISVFLQNASEEDAVRTEDYAHLNACLTPPAVRREQLRVGNMDKHLGGRPSSLRWHNSAMIRLAYSLTSPWQI